jgi:hypothetical protein
MTWLPYARLSAAATAILAPVGIQRVPSNIVTAICTALIVLSASCSGSGEGSDGMPPSMSCTPSPNACVNACNPCTRLSDAQIAAVVGQSAVGQQVSDFCEWDFTDSKGDTTFTVALGVNLGHTWFENECHPGNQPEFTYAPVKGVGDDACINPVELLFLKGCDAYDVSIRGTLGGPPPFSDAMVQSFEKALALDAVPNL